MKADQQYARRAAQRLNALIDEQGGPFDLLGRSKTVAEMVECSEQEARQLLSGLVPWSWDQLAKTCQVFSKPPGFFLDEHPVPGIPTDTKVVQGADGGETIVWRGPRGFSKHAIPDNARLRYITQHYGGGRYAVGSMLLYAESESGRPPLRQGSGYVIESEAGFEAMRCVDVRANVASFESERPGAVVRMVPYTDDVMPRASLGLPRIAGNIFASITAHP